MSGKHTPTPWSVPKTDTVAVVAEGNDYERRRRVVTRTLYKPHQRARAEANAAFIVKAVNAHDKLVKALEEIARDRGGHMGEYHADCQNIATAALASIKEPEE